VEGIWNTEPPYLLLNKWRREKRRSRRKKEKQLEI
jgi:hypothetical protein